MDFTAGEDAGDAEAEMDFTIEEDEGGGGEADMDFTAE